MRTTLTNSALTEQEQQKRFSGLEETLGRFRWTGDLRVRGESFFQKYSGCTLCNDRNRVRVRFGFEGKRLLPASCRFTPEHKYRHHTN